MGEARTWGLVIALLAAALLAPGTALAEAVTVDSPGEGIPEAVERTLYDIFGLGQDLGDARCADVTLMSQDAAMTVQPYVAAENVGVELAGAPAPVSDTIVVMAYPLSCAEYVLGLLAPESQDMDRLLP